MIVAYHFQVATIDILDYFTGDFTGGMDFYKAVNTDNPVNQLGNKAKIMGNRYHSYLGSKIVEDFKKLVFHSRINIGCGFIKEQ